MKKNFLIIGFVVLSLGFTSCDKKGNTNQNTGNTTEEAEMAEKGSYTCTMHPEVVSDKPGKCPKCGMELVMREDDHNNGDHQHSDSTTH